MLVAATFALFVGATCCGAFPVFASVPDAFGFCSSEPVEVLASSFDSSPDCWVLSVVPFVAPSPSAVSPSVSVEPRSMLSSSAPSSAGVSCEVVSSAEVVSS